MESLFCPYELAVKLKNLGFDEPCFGAFFTDDLKIFPFANDLKGYVSDKNLIIGAPLYQQAINFLYICSNKQIDIELKASDTYEERLRKVDQGCEDLWNLQNSKPN